MQNRKAVLISLVCALVAMVMVVSYVSQKERRILRMASPVKVVLAARDIPEGTRLDRSWLKVAKIPKKFVQPGTSGDVEDWLGKTVVIPVLKDTQVMEPMFSSSRQGRFSVKVPPDQRAFSVAVSEVSAVSGLIGPGDFVDVMVTVEEGDIVNGQAVSRDIKTRTILQNALVLAVNRIYSDMRFRQASDLKQQSRGSLLASPTDDEPAMEKLDNIRTVTLSLSPQDAQKMSLAQEIGSISLMLRSSWDESGGAAPIPSINAREFLGIKKMVIPRSRPAWVEIRGAEEVYR
ncbi:MAG: Flp pilus assembly protein CpaB [Deltaproteobacteria bacterium]|nr:MAG: Flp pilus assembly protein CpaB [Deltaproteobacteria bacterium]